MKPVCVIQTYWPDLCPPARATPDPVGDLRNMVSGLGFTAMPLNTVDLP